MPALPLEQADPKPAAARDVRVDEVGLTDEQIRHARHAYYAAVSYMDERIGEVLGALHDIRPGGRRRSCSRADHGEFLGERGLWYKMSFLEPSARVPLIVRRPGRRGGRVPQPVSLLDVAPTVLELAGLRAERCRRHSEAGEPRRRGGRRGPPPVARCSSEYHAEGVTGRRRR